MSTQSTENSEYNLDDSQNADENPLLSTAVILPLVRLLAWGRLDRQPATGYLLGQFTMPWQGKLNRKSNC